MADFDFVQSKQVDGQSLAFDSNVTAGNFVVVQICRDNGNTATVSKQAGTATVGTFTRDEEQTNTQHLELWHATVTGTGSLTIQVAYTGSPGNHRLGIGEYVGPGTGVEVVDTASLHNDPATTTPTSGNVTFTAAGLLVSAMTPTGVALNAGAGTGFTIRAESTADGAGFEDKKVAGAGTEAGTWINDTSDKSNVIAVAFQAVAGGGGPEEIEASRGEIIIEGRPPSFLASRLALTASRGELILQGQQASVMGVTQPGAATLTIEGGSATVHAVVTGQTGTLIIQGGQATLANLSQLISAGRGELVIEGADPAVAITVRAGAGLLTIEGRQPGVLAVGLPGTATIEVQGRQPDTWIRALIEPSTGTIEIQGGQASIQGAQSVVNAGFGAIEIIGGAATIVAYGHWVRIDDAGSVSWSVQAGTSRDWEKTAGQSVSWTKH